MHTLPALAEESIHTTLRCRDAKFCRRWLVPDELNLEALPILGATVGGAAEACGDAVDVAAVGHGVQDPLAAGLDAGARLVGELHGDVGTILCQGDRRHLADAEAGAHDPDDRLAEVRHLALDLVEVAAGELGRRSAPM